MVKKNTIKFHIILWLIVMSFPLFYSLTVMNEAILIPFIFKSLITFLSDITSFYLFYFLLSQKIFTRKGIVIITLLGISYTITSGLSFTTVSYFTFKYFYTISVKPFETPLGTYIGNNLYGTLARNLIFSILGSLSKVSYIWYNNRVKQKETEKQNITNELAMLRAQINPHFLFNTLNNIKSLVLSLPEKAVYSTDKLIGIMNYMLFESSVNTVPFEKEMEYINNYLDLERIRFLNPEYVSCEVSGDYSKIMIPPLIFMPFIENTFKHGNKLKPAPAIIIKFNVSETRILFEIKNYVKENYIMHGKKSGFGLSNIKRRLDLLFENKYELIITNENSIYTVKLNLNLI